MSSRPTPPPPSAPGRLLQELLDGFKAALRQEGLRRYGLTIILERAEKLVREDGRRGNRTWTAQADEHRASLVADICCRSIDFVVSPLRLVVSHVGGNVYEIRGSLEGESSKWAYALCGSQSQPRMLSLGKKMAAFCLSVIEHKLGRRILKQLGKTATNGDSKSGPAEGSRDRRKLVAGASTAPCLLGT